MLLFTTPFFAQNNERKKVDGVAAVVGDYLILESDIDKAYIDLQQQEVDTREINRCQMLGKLMEDKLYAHQAVQDSVKLTDSEVRDQVNQRIEFFNCSIRWWHQKTITVLQKRWRTIYARRTFQPFEGEYARSAYETTNY